MTLKNDAKLEKKMTFFKNTGRIWQIFTRALKSLKIGTLRESFNPK